MKVLLIVQKMIVKNCNAANVKLIIIGVCVCVCSYKFKPSINKSSSRYILYESHFFIKKIIYF